MPDAELIVVPLRNLRAGLPRDRVREIDIYRSGLMFEKDNVVGVVPRR